MYLSCIVYLNRKPFDPGGLSLYLALSTRKDLMKNAIIFVVSQMPLERLPRLICVVTDEAI